MIGYALLTAAWILGVSLPTQAATAPTRLVVAYAAMSPRVAPLWAAHERGFLSKTVLMQSWFSFVARQPYWLH